MYVFKAFTSVIVLITFIESFSEALSEKELDEYLAHYKPLKENINKKLENPFLETNEKGCYLCINEAVEHEIVQLNFYKSYLQKITSNNDLKINDKFLQIADSDTEYKYSKEVIGKNFDNWVASCDSSFPDMVTDPLQASFPATVSVDLRNHDKLVTECLNDYISAQVDVEKIKEIYKDYETDLEAHTSFAESVKSSINKPNQLCLDCIKTFLEHEMAPLETFIVDLDEGKQKPDSADSIAKAKIFLNNFKKYKRSANKWIGACGTHYEQELSPEIDVSAVTSYIDITNFITKEGTKGLEKCMSTFVINSMVYYRPKFEVKYVKQTGYDFYTKPSATLKVIE